MSERTFRAVVAAVLVGALVLAAVVAIVVLQPPAASPGPSAGSTPRPTQQATPTPVPTPTPTPPVAFAAAALAGVGDVLRGGSSGTEMVLTLTEQAADAIPDAPGSFTVTLADAAGAGATIAFAGAPLLEAPDSLGVTAELVAANVLRISIVASDRANVEPITVTGLRIAAGDDAALGPIGATLGGFEGSLVGGVANAMLPSPGSVVAP